MYSVVSRVRKVLDRLGHESGVAIGWILSRRRRKSERKKEESN